MNFTLIVCTYMRPNSLLKLLNSVNKQTLYPNEILIIDGSTNNDTESIINKNRFNNLYYFKINESDRGLTKQRNFGIDKVAETSEVVCFLDDDVILEPDYFEQIIETYTKFPDAIAVGGYITNEVSWELSDNQNSRSKFYYDDWMRNEPLRFKLRRFFGLQPDVPPGFMPSFSHGRSIGFLPPSGKTYNVEQMMGCALSYRRILKHNILFSTFFEGYGLYEDTDFSLRLARKGKLYVNTCAQLEHYHDSLGRPNKYRYGKMVIRNGWYVWHVKYPKPSLIAKLKWHATALLLTKIRLFNVITTSSKKGALTESLGRIVSWFSLIFNPPKQHQ